MNIFVTHPNPIQSAVNLPDKHVVKMPLESVQMLSVIYSPWYYDTGVLHRANGEPYKTERGAFRNHPCTIWAAANKYNLAWLIKHGQALSDEYTYRYDKRHACHIPLIEAEFIYESMYPHDTIDDAWQGVAEFSRAMPEYLKSDFTITTIQAYKAYLNTKSWVATNYLRIPSRKPSFITTMQTVSSKDINYNEEALTPSQQQQAKALEKAMAAADATKGLVPTPKAAKTSPAKKGKAGRIVGISKDENEFLQTLLLDIMADHSYDEFIEKNQAAYDKLVARYNK